MHRRTSAVLGFVLCATSAACGALGANATTTPPTALTCATDVVSTWSTPRLAREVVVVSAPSTSTSIMTAAAADGFGGIILFGTTVPATLVATLRELPSLSPSHLNLAVMTDDEGGGVIRTPALTGTWPWAQVMGATMTPAQIEAIGRRVGLALAKAGITMDLAPVADVDGRAVWPSATNPDGYRSFGASPTRDGVDAGAFALGLQSAGVVATIKHFPGLGGASANTDYGPATTKTWVQLQSGGLIPFRAAISDGAKAVMMSNATVPGLTTGPATLSAAAVTALRALGFHGLIVTDALVAGAIGAVGLSPSAAGVKAIAAGDDQVLGGTPTTPQSGLTTALQMAAAINAAVVKGPLTRAQLVAAAAQVVATVNPQICRSL